MTPLRRHPAVNWAAVHDDVVVVDPRRDPTRVHVLKGASAIVWVRLDGGGVDELTDRMRHEFDLDQGRAEADVGRAVELLRHENLLDDVSSPRTG